MYIPKWKQINQLSNYLNYINKLCYNATLLILLIKEIKWSVEVQFL